MPPGPPPRLFARLGRASHRQSFLWKLALGVIALGIVTGLILSSLRSADSASFGQRTLARAGLAFHGPQDNTEVPLATPQELLQSLAHETSTAKVNVSDVLRAVPALATYIAPADYPLFQTALRRALDEHAAGLATDYLAAWLPGDPAALGRLQQRADAAQPARYANYAVGRIELKQKNPRIAYERFLRENDFHEAPEARFYAALALAETNDPKALAELLKDPRFTRFNSPYVALQAAVRARDWAAMWQGIVTLQLESLTRPIMIVALVTALGWGLFLVHFGEVPSPRTGYFALCLCGVVAGVISIMPTVFLVLVEDEILGFSPGQDPIRILLYNIAGVGLREEACKLLLFVPFLPFLRRRGDELMALTVACFVGLGFAAEENGGYFAFSAAASAPGRFLTANFFHIALTGLNGLALFRAVTCGARGVNEFLTVFPLTVVAHGVFDALLDSTLLGDSGFLAIALYIGFCYMFFNRVRPLRSNVRMTLSLTGTFVFGFSLVAATMIAFQFATLGAPAAMPLVVTEMLGNAVLLVMFFREFNEPLMP